MLVSKEKSWGVLRAGCMTKIKKWSGKLSRMEMMSDSPLFCLLNFQPVEDRVLILDNLIPFVFNVIENLMDVLADLRS